MLQETSSFASQECHKFKLICMVPYGRCVYHLNISFPFFSYSHKTTRNEKEKKKNSFSISFMADGNIGIFFRFTICLHVMLYSQVLVHILCVVPNSILLHSQSSQKFCDFFPFHSHSLCLFSRLWIIMHETIAREEFFLWIALCLVLVSNVAFVWEAKKRSIFIDLRLRMRKSSARATHIHPHTFFFLFILPQAFFSFIETFSSFPFTTVRLIWLCVGSRHKKKLFFSLIVHVRILLCSHICVR